MAIETDITLALQVSFFIYAWMFYCRRALGQGLAYCSLERPGDDAEEMAVFPDYRRDLWRETEEA